MKMKKKANTLAAREAGVFRLYRNIVFIVAVTGVYVQPAALLPQPLSAVEIMLY